MMNYSGKVCIGGDGQGGNKNGRNDNLYVMYFEWMSVT